MATSSSSSDSPPNWPTAGKIMTEEAYHELEQLSPDRKYEYISGQTYMMSGSSVAHDRIAYNVRFALDVYFRSGPCTVFGADVQVLLGVKKSGKRHFVYPDATVSCDITDRAPDNTLVEVWERDKQDESRCDYRHYDPDETVKLNTDMCRGSLP